MLYIKYYVKTHIGTQMACSNESSWTHKFNIKFIAKKISYQCNKKNMNKKNIHPMKIALH
jgi:hypothetical protein